MAEPMNAIALGVHVVDVLVRPVEQIPERQGGELVEEIRITPGGDRRRDGGHAREARAPWSGAPARSAATSWGTCYSRCCERLRGR